MRLSNHFHILSILLHLRTRWKLSDHVCILDLNRWLVVTARPNGGFGWIEILASP